MPRNISRLGLVKLMEIMTLLAGWNEAIFMNSGWDTTNLRIEEVSLHSMDTEYHEDNFNHL